METFFFYLKIFSSFIKLSLINKFGMFWVFLALALPLNLFLGKNLILSLIYCIIFYSEYKIVIVCVLIQFLPIYIYFLLLLFTIDFI